MKRTIKLLSILLLVLPAYALLEVHEGFPVMTDSYVLRESLVTADIDRDGKLEIIAVPDNRKIKVFNSSGVLLWENVSGSLINDSDYARLPVARNLTGDGKLEVLTYGNSWYSYPTFYMWDSSGKKLGEMLIGYCLVSTSPSVSREGLIISGVAPGNCFDPVVNGTGVHAFDTAGNHLWYLELGRKASIYASVPLADLDGDGLEEAIVLTNGTNLTDGTVWAIKMNRTEGSVLWSIPLGGSTKNAAVGDVNNDGRNEVVVVSSSVVYIFDGNSYELNRFSINSNNAIPTIGDLDGDGVNEVITVSDSEPKLFIISNGSMREVPITKRSVCNVAIGDLNRDRRLELVTCDINNRIYIWNYTGTPIDQWVFSGEYFSSVTIADLERDGNNEIILGNHDGQIHVLTNRKDSGDIIPPITSDDVDGIWHNSITRVTLTAEDNESGVDTTFYTMDGSLPEMSSASGNMIDLNDDGIYTIRYFSIDRAGNIEVPKTAVNQTKIDKLSPVSWDDHDLLWHASETSINLSVQDSMSGVAALNYIIDGAGNQSPGNVSLTFIDEGVHTVQYYGVDNAGNSEVPKNISVMIDMSPPVTSDDTVGRWYNDSVTVRLSANDYLSGVNATYNKVTSVPLSVLDTFFSWLGNILGMTEGYAEGDNVTLSNEGIYIVTYYSSDRLGNTEAEKATGQVKIDKILPTATVTVPINKTYLPSESITLDFSAQDGLSGIKNIVGSIDGIRQVSSGEVLNMGTLNGGGHEFILTAEDNASNLITRTVQFSVAGETLQGKGYVNGTVMDNNSAAGISGAKVITQTGIMATANELGFYSLYLDPGTFNLTVTSEPEYYQNNSVAVTVISGATAPQDINLTKKPAGTITGNVANI